MPSKTLTAVALKARIPQAIAQAQATGALQRIGDGDGLMLAVRASGEASWLLRYSLDGQRRDLTLGRWPTVDLKLARDKADAARRRIAAGADPMDERKAQRQERRRAKMGEPVRGLFEAWLDTQAHSARYRDNIEAAFMKDVLPAIGAMPPHEVMREHIVKILRAIEERGAVVMVRRVRMWLRQMFEFGIEHEDWPDLKASPVPMSTLKSFKQVRKDRGKKRHFPALSNARDVAPLMRKIRGLTDNFVIRNALLLSAHVWQRPSEIRLATWDEFDLEAGKWTIPAHRMKLAEEHWVPLSRQVVALLRHYQGIVGTEGYLFPGRKYGQPISEGTLTSRLNTMGYRGKHSPHGFRAMARTIGAEVLGIEAKYLEKQLSHEHERDDKHRGAYNRAEYWEHRIRMMQAWSDWLDAQT